MERGVYSNKTYGGRPVFLIAFEIRKASLPESGIAILYTKLNPLHWLN